MSKTLEEMTAWQRKWLRWPRERKDRWHERVKDLEAGGYHRKIAQYAAYEELAEES